MQEGNAELVHTLDEASSKIISLKNKNDTLIKEHNKLSQEFKSQIKALESENYSLKTSIQTLEQNLATQKKMNSIHEHYAKTLDEKFSKLRGDHPEISDVYAGNKLLFEETLHAQLGQGKVIRESLEAANLVIRKKRKKIHNLRKELKIKIENIQELENKLKIQNEVFETRCTLLYARAEKSQTLEASIKEQGEMIKVLEDGLDMQIKCIEELKNELKKEQTKNQALEEQIKNHQQRIEAQGGFAKINKNARDAAELQKIKSTDSIRNPFTFFNLAKEPPSALVCPITLEIMEDPVVVADGVTFERRAIKQWLDQGKDTNPITRNKITTSTLVSNYSVKNLCEDYKEFAKKIENLKLTPS